MIKKLVSIALLAGLLSGIGATIFQTIYVLPLILEAETFEVAAPVTEMAAADGHDHDHGHAHGEEGEWAPQDGLQRTIVTAGANLFGGMGFALLLLAAIYLRGGEVNARSGLIWGAAGFVSFSLAPFFGLPPELPGMSAAALESRQLWWVATAALTAGGLWVMTSRSGAFSTPMKLASGLLLIVAPHAYGAPQLPHGGSLVSAVPAHLSAEFAVAALAHGLIFWLLIGGAAGWLCQRFNIVEGGHSADPVPNQG